MTAVRALVASALLAACSADPSVRIVARVDVAGADAADVAAVRAAVEAQTPDVLVALDDGALVAARAAAPELRTVAIAAARAEDPRRAVLEAVIVADSGAAAAVDLALLACNGIPLPPEVELGTRVVDAANAAAGGAPRPRPGDIGLAMLRRQHAEVLSTSPSIDIVFRVAFVAIGGAGARVHGEVAAAAAKYPQLELVRRDAADGGALAGVLTQLAADGVRVVIVPGSPAVVPDGSASAAAARAVLDAAARAGAGRLAVVPVAADGVGGSCVVGQDPAALGREAAGVVRSILGREGDLVVLAAPASRLREQGFAAGLERE